MKGILINNGKALGDGSGKVFTVQSEKGNPVTVYTEGEMNSLIIAENVDKIFKYIGDDGEYTKDHIYQVVDENGTLTIKDLSMGIALPPVTNINLNSGGVLYWNKPDTSNIDANFKFVSISYEIEFNGVSLTSDKESVNVYAYVVEGQNTASVKAIGVFKFNVNNKEKEVLVEYKTPETLAIFVLGEKLPTLLCESTSALVGSNAYIFGGKPTYGSTSTSGYSNAIIKFDITTEKATKIETKFPSSVSCATAIAVGSVIYIFGGGYGNYNHKAIYKFDAITETLTTLTAKLPGGMGRQGMLGAIVGNIIYLFGGISRTNSGSDTKHKDVIKFDTITETIIETLPDILPSTYAGYSKAAAIGTNIYFLRTMYLGTFDTITETYSESSWLVQRYTDHNTAEAVGTNIYTFGGDSTNVIYRVDTIAKTLTTLEETLPTKLYDMTSVLFDNTVYIFGGKFATSTYSDEILKVINLS